MTDQNRRDEAAQPGQHQTDPADEPVSQSGPPNDNGAASAPSDGGPGQPFVVHDKRRRPSPRPRPRSGPDGSQPQDNDQAKSERAGSEATPRSGETATEPAADQSQDTAAGTGDGARRTGSDTATESPTGGFAAELQALRSDLEERTKDLQRITAEYANYRRRVERDRRLVVEQATAGVLGELLGVLDDLDRARTHGDLVGPFGAVAEQLISVLAKLGLSAFGEKGDAFDPTRHEAVAHSVSTEVTEPTCVEVFRRGYGYGERLLRPALVAVADPGEEEPAEAGAAAEAPSESSEPSGEPTEQPAPGSAADAATEARSTGNAPGGSTSGGDTSGGDTPAGDASGGATTASAEQDGAGGGSDAATGSHGDKSTGNA